MPTVAFNICCPRDAVSRTAHVGTVGKNGLSSTAKKKSSLSERLASFGKMEAQLRAPQTPQYDSAVMYLFPLSIITEYNFNIVRKKLSQIRYTSFEII